tara:strand:- start:133 stop:510 length:378 start_codon:yes stop_codon:yes gene_type:complete
MEKFFKISEISKILNLVDPKTNKPQNHVLRYWEKEFKQIKPKKINNQRYYSVNQLETIKMIKFFLKNKRMTISGVKNLLKMNNKLDDYNKDSLKADYHRKEIKLKTIKLLEKIKTLKNYGKKNSS